MNIWKKFAANEVTHSTAHYLTTVHELHERRGYARVSDVARELDVTKGAASIQMKHLKEKGFVDEDENHFFFLTEAGEAVAHEVANNRQILMRFLNSVLGVQNDQAEIDACKIEHLLSRETSHSLLALVRLLQSDGQVVRKFREHFRKYMKNHPSAGHCNLCSVDDLTLCNDGVRKGGGEKK